MKPFALYTLARLLMFVAAWGLVWLVASIWLEWSAVTALWTALFAMVISSVASLALLRGLRDQLATRVEDRADSIRRRYEEAKTKEDADGG